MLQASCAHPWWTFLTKFPSRYLDFMDHAAVGMAGTSVDEQKRVRFAEDAFRRSVTMRRELPVAGADEGGAKVLDLSVYDLVIVGAQTETRQPDGLVPAFAPPFDRSPVFGRRPQKRGAPSG